MRAQKQLQLKEEQLARKVKDVEDGFQEHEQQLKRNFLRREQDLQVRRVNPCFSVWASLHPSSE